MSGRPSTAWEDARVPRTARVTPEFPGPRLQAIWARGPGLMGWIGDVDHKLLNDISGLGNPTAAWIGAWF